MFLNLRPKCANLSCAASFDWLGGGRRFRFPRKQRELASAGNNILRKWEHPIEHFWLCERCATFTHFATSLIAES